MKLSDYVIDFLVKEGVTHIFEICGGALAHLLDSVYDRKDIKTVSMHHEQAAAFAAEGYSRTNSNIGVAMATSGPGATNLITGIGSCYFDSIPCLFITGQVNTYEYKLNDNDRQSGFQETDIVSIVKPITKYAVRITDPNEIRYRLEKAVFMAKSGRPGPVLIDIPLNIQRAEIKPDKLKSYSINGKLKDTYNQDTIEHITQSIKNSIRPVILVGGGVRLSGATEELLKFVNKTGIPVVTSLMGLDAFPHDNPSFVGMIGSYGNRYANLTIANADLVLVIGTRLDTRQTGTRPETFARGAKIIYVNIEPLNSKIKVSLSIAKDAERFLTILNDNMGEYDKGNTKGWKDKVNGYKRQYPSFKVSNDETIDPNFFMHKLSEYLPDDAIVCVDVGQHQMWSAQSLEVRENQRFITQGGMGAMGSALSLAIGASFANPDKVIVVITGDGGFQLNIQELQTIHDYDLLIKIIMLNNSCYGMVRQFQEQYFESRFQSTEYNCPDFIRIILAYGILATGIFQDTEIDMHLESLFSDTHTEFLEVEIPKRYKALPKLSVNRPVEDQLPLLSREELKSNMIVDVLP